MRREAKRRRVAVVLMQKVVRGFIQKQKYNRILEHRKQSVARTLKKQPVIWSARLEKILQKKAIQHEIFIVDREIQSLHSIKQSKETNGAKSVGGSVRSKKSRHKLSVEALLRRTKLQLALMKESADVIHFLRKQNKEQQEECRRLKEEDFRLKSENHKLAQTIAATERTIRELKVTGNEMKESNQKLLDIVAQYKDRFARVRSDLKERHSFYKSIESAHREERKLRLLCEEALLDVTNMINDGSSNSSLRKTIASKVDAYQRSAGRGASEVPVLAEESDLSNSSDGSLVSI